MFFVIIENYVTQFVTCLFLLVVTCLFLPVVMTFLQAGLRESRKTRSRSPYPRSLALDSRTSYEGRYVSLSERPMSQDHVQRKFSAPTVHSSVTSDFLGSDSLSGVSSGSGSLSLSEVGLFIYLFFA